MEKFLKIIFYVLLALFGGFIGWKLAHSAAHLHPIISENIRSFIGLGILLGFILTPTFVKLFLMFIDYAVKFLNKLSLQELVLGSIGMIFGLVIAVLMNFILRALPLEEIPVVGPYFNSFLIIVLTIFWCYIGILLTTKFSFIQGFSQLFGAKQTSFLGGTNYKILDTSTVIDGRVLDVCKAGFLEGNLLIPEFILKEIQTLSDSDDSLKRAKGRRALDLLNKIKKEIGFDITKKEYPQAAVDEKLVAITQDLKATLVSLDYNLVKVAQIQGLKVLNINELANAVKPIIIPGEFIEVKIIKEGKEPDQGVAYLDDGTMIVVEGGKRYIGQIVRTEVTSIIQTTAGKMVFAEPRVN
ncbi:MAG: TRAM domain-containing protein [Armatimonadota bacterium]